MYKHILIPTDGSETADKAVDAGIDYARETGAQVTFFTAMPEYELPSTSAMMAHQPVVSLAEHERRSAEKANAILGKALMDDEYRARLTDTGNPEGQGEALREMGVDPTPDVINALNAAVTALDNFAQSEVFGEVKAAS